MLNVFSAVKASLEDDVGQLTLGFDDLFEPEAQAVAGSPRHDLSNLLTVIIGASETLIEALGDRPDAAELARVCLLAAERAAQIAAEPAAAAELAAAKAEPEVCDPLEATVVVVDDDPQMLKLMSQAFAKAGFKTFSAKNGRVALQIVRAARPDLVVTDIVMPEVEGLAAIREIRALAPDTRIVAISGGGQYSRSDSFLSWAEGLGADEVLAKPFKMSSLMTAARLLLERRETAAAN